MQRWLGVRSDRRHRVATARRQMRRLMLRSCACAGSAHVAMRRAVPMLRRGVLLRPRCGPSVRRMHPMRSGAPCWPVCAQTPLCRLKWWSGQPWLGSRRRGRPAKPVALGGTLGCRMLWLMRGAACSDGFRAGASSARSWCRTLPRMPHRQGTVQVAAVGSWLCKADPLPAYVSWSRGGSCGSARPPRSLA